MELKGDTTDPARPTIWLNMLSRRYSIFIRNICLMYNYRVYNNLFWIFLIQMKYHLQSMYNHMVGRAASVISPFYFILLVQKSSNNCWVKFTSMREVTPGYVCWVKFTSTREGTPGYVCWVKFTSTREVTPGYVCWVKFTSTRKGTPGYICWVKFTSTREGTPCLYKMPSFWAKILCFFKKKMVLKVLKASFCTFSLHFSDY